MQVPGSRSEGRGGQSRMRKENVQGPTIPDIRLFPPAIRTGIPNLKLRPLPGGLCLLLEYQSTKINNRRMERGGNPTKRVGRKLAKGQIGKFFDRKFDWIALLLITVIILLSLVFF